MSTLEPSAGPPRTGPISVRGATIGAATLGLLSVLVVGLIGMVSPGYGGAYLDVLASLFPGFQNDGAVIDLLVGSLYGALDGGLLGFLFAKFHNSVCELDEQHEAFIFWPTKKRHLIGPWLVFKKHRR